MAVAESSEDDSVLDVPPSLGSKRKQRLCSSVELEFAPRCQEGDTCTIFSQLYGHEIDVLKCRYALKTCAYIVWEHA